MYLSRTWGKTNNTDEGNETNMYIHMPQQLVNTPNLLLTLPTNYLKII